MVAVTEQAGEDATNRRIGQDQPDGWVLGAGLLLVLILLLVLAALFMSHPAGLALAALGAACVGMVLFAGIAWSQRKAARLLEASIAARDESLKLLAQTQAEALRNRQLLERAVEALPVGIEIYTDKDELLLANQQVKRWFPHLDFDNTRGQSFEALLRSSQAQGTLPLEALGQEEDWVLRRLARRGEEDRHWIQHWPNGLSLMIYERYTPEGYLVAARQDVSELVVKERALQASQAKLQAIIGTVGVAIITLDVHGGIRSANPTTERMLGYSHEELISQDVDSLMEGPMQAAIRDYMAQYQSVHNAEEREQLHRQREFGVLHKSGRELTVQMALAEVRAGDELVFVAVLTDITERKRFETELQHANEQLLRLSTTDSLTELANRRLLMTRLEDEWRRALRSNAPLSLLLIDVDFFKLYNDHYGHPAGDACLQIVAGVLKTSANRPSDLVARYGGEEFVALLPQTDIEGAQAVAQRIMNGLREAAMQHDMSPLGPHITVSMGLVSGQAHGASSAAQWLAQSDLALYQAKAQGRNRVVSVQGY